MTSILFVADTHCGHVLGLTHPDYHGARSIRGLQERLWQWWAEEIKAIGPVDYLVLDGDLIDGPGKKDTIGLWTTDVEEQVKAAIDAVSVVKARRTFVCYGTPFHTVSTLSAENLIARELGAEIRDTLRLRLQGKGWELRFNTRHVQGRSDIPTGQGAQTGKEAIREIVQAALEEYDAADVIARAHTHYKFRIDIAGRTAFSIPCLMLPDPDRGRSIYARKLRTLYYDVGFALAEIDDAGEMFLRFRTAPLKAMVPKEYICLKANAAR